MNGFFKLGVGNYYLYDAENNMLGKFDSITKEVFSATPDMVGFDLNLIECKVNFNLIPKLKTLDKVIAEYQISQTDNQGVSRIYYTLLNARIENYKILSKKDNNVATVNFKITTSSIDKCLKKDIDILTDYTCEYIKDTFKMLSTIWNDVSEDNKFKLYNEIYKLYDQKFCKDLITNLMQYEIDTGKEIRAGMNDKLQYKFES